MSQSEKPKIVVFASGDKDGGGSGFEMLVNFSRTTPPVLNADIVGVVSNFPAGGVRKRADKFGIPFHHLPRPFTAEKYQESLKFFDGEWAMLSGWLKFARGLDPRKTVNIHPGPLPEFGGKGMHGHHVHEAVMAAYREGRIKQSAVSMHFVDPNYSFDSGPVFFELPVLIDPDDTPDSLAAKVNKIEHAWQAHILNLVVHGIIRLEVMYDSWVIRSPDGRIIPGMGKNLIKFMKPVKKA
jgi:folate-dependent phosphoribosylglycinamide formyltransferase PurN